MMSRRLKMALVCVAFLGGFLGIGLMAWAALRIFPLTPQNFMDFFTARVGLNILSHLYPPMTFWILTWLSRVHVEDPVFSEAEAGKIILSFGAALLVFAEGPAFFSPGWLRSDLWFQGDLWVLYNTFYAIGWCFLLVGMFRWPAMRSILLYG